MIDLITNWFSDPLMGGLSLAVLLFMAYLGWRACSQYLARRRRHRRRRMHAHRHG
jgi:hypothetical protein